MIPLLYSLFGNSFDDDRVEKLPTLFLNGEPFSVLKIDRSNSPELNMLSGGTDYFIEPGNLAKNCEKIPRKNIFSIKEDWEGSYNYP